MVTIPACNPPGKWTFIFRSVLFCFFSFPLRLKLPVSRAPERSSAQLSQGRDTEGAAVHPYHHHQLAQITCPSRTLSITDTLPKGISSKPSPSQGAVTKTLPISISCHTDISPVQATGWGITVSGCFCWMTHTIVSQFPSPFTSVPFYVRFDYKYRHRYKYSSNSKALAVFLARSRSPQDKILQVSAPNPPTFWRYFNLKPKSVRTSLCDCLSQPILVSGRVLFQDN